MGCLDGNCFGKLCKPEIASPHIPPAKVGWRLVGWPDFVPESFRGKFAKDPVWNGNSPDDVVNSIVHVLKSNRIKIDNAELCSWANGQWCAADPARCRTAKSRDARLGARQRAALISDNMLWATPFWRVWNVAVSGDGRPDSDARPTMELFAEAASVLLNGESGCPKCAKHFDELLLSYPTGKINTWRQARVWLWRVHNESRDNGRTVPWHDVAKIYGWGEMSDSEVLRIVEEELRA